MKKFLRLSWGADSTPIRLLGAIVLSFMVMIYVNTAVGTFGGIPLFVAFALIFYLIRSVFVAGNRICHFTAITSDKELGRLFLSYAEGYIISFWVMRLVQVFAKIAGWGNVSGMSVGKYITELYGTTIMERWAYVFSFVFVTAFMLSLFPLIVIKRVRAWIIYVIGDVIFHTLFVLGIIAICMPYIPKGYKRRVHCLIDALLLCNIRSTGRVILYLIIIGVYVVVAVAGSFYIVKRYYHPKPGKEVTNPESFAPMDKEEIDSQRKKMRRKMLAYGSIVVLIIAAVATYLSYYFFVARDEENKYVKVGCCLTNDLDFGPIRYGETVYIPVNLELDYNETGKPLGYLAIKEEDNTSSRYYRLAIANLLYKSSKEKDLYIQVYGQERHVYLPASYLEKHPTWIEDEIFLLWDEDWKSESRYTKDVTGYSVCPKAMIDLLEEEFGQVYYDIEAFEEADSYFTLSGYENMQQAFMEGAYPGNWVGCILVKDEVFYYGNFENEITGEAKEILMAVLGGAVPIESEDINEEPSEDSEE